MVHLTDVMFQPINISSKITRFIFCSLGRVRKQEKNISTVGVDVCDWVYPKKTDFAFGRGDNRPSIKFSTWDFGGQVRLGSCHDSIRYFPAFRTFSPLEDID